MKRKYVYNICVISIDFVAYFLLSLFACVIFTRSFNELDTAFIVSSLVLSLIKIVFNLVVGNYRLLWAYSIRRNMVRLITTSIGLDLLFLGLSFIPQIDNSIGFNSSIYFSLMLLEFFYFVTSRYFISLYLNKAVNSKNEKEDKISKTELPNTLIIGAGGAGAMVLNEIGNKKEFGYNIVGFVDDSQDKIGTIIGNVKVYGPISTINELVETMGIKKIIVAIPSAGMTRIREIVNSINYKNISVEIVPDKSKMLQSGIKSTIRKVDIADLLGREAIELDTSRLNEFINGKTILVTGGGGSIGSEICRQVLQYHPKQLVIFDIYENTTYELKTELDMTYRTGDYHPNYIALIGSVRDRARLEEVFSQYKPDIIFHAAAHKHVPLMEDSPYETVKNNIIGTYNVADYADKYGAEKMVLISTDKAVNPTNVMGASKRFCEMVVEAWNKKSKHTNYSMVRFGNVLGSHGSVIPLFKKQIENGGPVTVTSDKINRFFMTIPEACGLVIQSGAYAKGGEKFILDMGEPVKIIDLAKNLIKLSGLELGKDIDIEITGLRPGEKLYEEILLKTANATKTENDKIYVEYSKYPLSISKIDEIISHLLEIGHENQKVLEYLKEIEIIKEK